MTQRVRKNIADIIAELQSEVDSVQTDIKIPDIITFCNDPEWLALPFSDTNPISLYPMQEIMLKAFYRGSVGNEDIVLTDEEIKRCENLGLVDNERGDVIGKYESGDIFNELILVWGRRAGKDFIVSIIALYEAMKLLEIPGGDPYAYYEIAADNAINILTVANARPQAKIAFDAIQSKLFSSKYFQDKFIPEGITSDSIYLLTPKDKEINKDRKKKGIPVKTGSVGIVVGHSNSDTLLGKGCMVLLLDEVASYKATGGSSSGDRIYTALTPTVKTYVKKIYEKNKKGKIKLDHEGNKIIKERQYDGKVISISSPKAKEGKFFELFKTTGNSSNRIACRLATWDVNQIHTRESLRASETSMSEAEFMMEYGAEFSGAAMQQFFTEDQVNSCFEGHSYKLREVGEPGGVYFVHLDPATSSHNYSVVVLHKEFYINIEENKSDYLIVVDHIKFWEPYPGKPIDVNKVDDYVIGLKRRFHIGMLTYDQMTSQESIMKLRKAGIPNKMTRYTHLYKCIIYRELENAVNAGRLKIPYHKHLKSEMIELQRKWIANGFKVGPKRDGDGVKTDDIVDSVSGALYIAVNKHANKLPSGRTVNMGTSPSSNNVMWRNMQGGAYGFGTGQQVSTALEKRASWPRYKR